MPRRHVLQDMWKKQREVYGADVHPTPASPLGTGHRRSVLTVIIELIKIMRSTPGFNKKLIGRYLPCISYSSFYFCPFAHHPGILIAGDGAPITSHWGFLTLLARLV